MIHTLYHTLDKELIIKGTSYTVYEAEECVYADIENYLNEDDIDINIISLYCHGSRVFGNPKEDSDLDFVLFYTGKFKEDSLFNIISDYSLTFNELICDINPIQLDESISFDTQILRYIKAHDIDYNNIKENYNVIKIDNAHALNEYGISSGFASNGFNCAGFSYSIMPLLFNLCQKGNDEYGKIHNKSFKHFVGDTVTGFCPYDEKKHKGIIKYLYYSVDNNETPKLVYIHDMEENVIVPLEANTVKNCSTPRPHCLYNNNAAINVGGIMTPGYDLGRYSPVRENKILDFNKLSLNESLADIDDEENVTLTKSNITLNNYKYMLLKIADELNTDKINCDIENNRIIVSYEDREYAAIEFIDDKTYNLYIDSYPTYNLRRYEPSMIEPLFTKLYEYKDKIFINNFCLLKYSVISYNEYFSWDYEHLNYIIDIPHIDIYKYNSEFKCLHKNINELEKVIYPSIYISCETATKIPFAKKELIKKHFEEQGFNVYYSTLACNAKEYFKLYNKFKDIDIKSYDDYELYAKEFDRRFRILIDRDLLYSTSTFKFLPYIKDVPHILAAYLAVKKKFPLFENINHESINFRLYDFPLFVYIDEEQVKETYDAYKYFINKYDPN